MNDSKKTQLEPGAKFYYSLPGWVKGQNDEVFASLATVLSELAMNPESPVDETVKDVLESLEETEEMRKTITKLVSEHPNDYGEIIWLKDGK